ncbi:hypothetical protein B0H13DRAFT_1865646 [Mycena leptocephala]|nr:hypothetical protein B0H13DRAFT_1865646 [Mycena leptocephala]
MRGFGTTWGPAYPILFLGFLVFNLQLALSTMEADALRAKSHLLASCYAAQAASSASASFPRYMAISLNRSYSMAVKDSLNVAQAALDLSITVIEAVIDFFVDTYRSTFLCFLELIVQAGLAVLTEAVAEATTFVEAAANNIANTIQQSFSVATSVVQGAISTANKIPGLNIPSPNLSPPDMSSPQSLTLPTTFEDQMDTPFSDLRAAINATFALISTDPSGFPIPAQANLAFCDHFDTSMIDDLSLDLKNFATWCTVALTGLAISIIIANSVWLWHWNRRLKENLSKIRRKWDIDMGPDGSIDEPQLLSMHSEISQPGLCWISERLRLSPSIEWLLFYSFHPSPLSCLLIGTCGMVVIQLQLWGLDRLHSDYGGKISIAVTSISDVIHASLNESITSQSATYATTLNSHMDEIQTAINGGVFGWVNATTTLLNDTIAGAYSDIQNAMTSAFGGTVLNSPIQDFIQCILGNKVDEVETALRFLQANLLSEDAMEEIVQKIVEAAVGGTAINPTGLVGVGTLVDSYKISLKKGMLMYEILTAFCLIILWGSAKA